MHLSGDFRCKDSPFDPNCRKLLCKLSDLDLQGGSIDIKCRCKHVNRLEASALTEERIES